MGVELIPAAPETRKALNRLAREQIKLRLLADIRFDLAVCEIEGWGMIMDIVKQLPCKS